MGIKRRTEEEIVEILREAEKSELSVADICRTYGIADVTFYKGRKRYGAWKRVRSAGFENLRRKTLSLKRLWANT
jgi:putative transposase